MRDVFAEDFKRFLIDADKNKLAISFMKALAYCPPSKELCDLIQRTILEYSRLSFESDDMGGGGIASDSRDYPGRDHSVVAALLALLADLDPDQIWQDSPEHWKRLLKNHADTSKKPKGLDKKPWVISPTDLYEALSNRAGKKSHSKSWPQSTRGLKHTITRIAADLKKIGIVVGAAEGIADGVGKLMFDQFGFEFQLLVQQGAGDGAETVDGLFFAAVAQTAQRGNHRRVREGTFSGTGGGEDENFGWIERLGFAQQ